MPPLRRQGQIRVLLGQKDLQSVAENDLFRWTVQLGAGGVAVSEPLQALDGRKLELGLAAPARHGPARYPDWLTSMGLPVARA